MKHSLDDFNPAKRVPKHLLPQMSKYHIMKAKETHATRRWASGFRFCCISNGELPNSHQFEPTTLGASHTFVVTFSPNKPVYNSLHLSFIAQTHQCRHGYAKNCSGNIPIHVLGQHEAVGQDTGTLSTWWDPFFEVLAPFRGHVGIRNVGFAKFSRIIQ